MGKRHCSNLEVSSWQQLKQFCYLLCFYILYLYFAVLKRKNWFNQKGQKHSFIFRRDKHYPFIWQWVPLEGVLVPYSCCNNHCFIYICPFFLQFSFFLVVYFSLVLIILFDFFLRAELDTDIMFCFLCCNEDVTVLKCALRANRRRY